MFVTCYWDTSALINAMVNPGVMARLQTDGGVTRPHALAEFFGQMTGPGIPTGKTRQRLTGNMAAAWLSEAGKFLDWVELDGPEVLAALAHAQAQNVQGGRVHDFLHAKAAVKAKADKILTRDAGFASLGTGIPCENP